MLAMKSTLKGPTIYSNPSFWLWFCTCNNYDILSSCILIYIVLQAKPSYSWKIPEGHRSLNYLNPWWEVVF